MDGRFRSNFRRGAVAGVAVMSVVAFLAGLAVRAYAGAVPDRPAVVDSRFGDRPGLSRPAAPVDEDCPPSSSPAVER
ncbi:hypothetical protein GCM10010112_00490 [Actinoplanes lobatus]|uniref:Uncharacterized protein n=1 Tax=Actinoplanes lobatus TaxID=113568 RepID=A0A7W7H9H7_9ACTN|nr:hypothetical protein [Actinoplanes lobatus]GGN52633.1 hypothetical protein GCM10010112_00490 [Actinoplanes lobatus]GIE45041.1 hypothetical protein Alo02nite_79390 [Actinoplanes lobatus]